jgi:hypothetical protein
LSFLWNLFCFLAAILPRFVNPTPAQSPFDVCLTLLREYNGNVLAYHWHCLKTYGMSHCLHLYNRFVKVQCMGLKSLFILNCYYCPFLHKSPTTAKKNKGMTKNTPKQDVNTTQHHIASLTVFFIAILPPSSCTCKHHCPNTIVQTSSPDR